MSLLIKALQKAEQKKTADGKTSASDNGLSLELTPIQSKTESDLIDETGFSQVSSAPTPNEKQHSQRAAAAVFSAKEVQTNKAGLSKSAVMAGAGLLLLLLLGGGFYYYLNSFNEPELAMPKPVAIAPQSPVPPPVTVANNNVPTNTPSSNSLITPPANATIVTQPVKPAAAVEKIVPAVPESATTVAEAMPAEAKYKAPRLVQKSRARSQQLIFGEPIEANENTTVKVTRNNPISGVNPDLLSAYTAFNAGDDASAQRLYRQVLQSDVRNVDALLGMAAIAARQGRNGDAAGWYGKVLEVEPRNGVAQAAIISVIGQTDPVGSESRIKNLLAQQPEAAYLYAALGNLYVQQNQWPAAQQAYFQAHHYDSTNAEYAFNLAVSLDQLGKTALALQYYKTTLELLPKSGAGIIDRAQVESRIAQLE